MAKTNLAVVPKKMEGGVSRKDSTFGLTKAEYKTFDMVVSHLESHKLLEKVDLEMVTVYCRLIELRRKFMRKLNDPEDFIQVYPTGALNIHPKVTALEKLNKEINTLSSMFGFSPKHREAIKAYGGDDSEGDALVQILAQLKAVKDAG